jgi:hypothetical protein
VDSAAVAGLCAASNKCSEIGSNEFCRLGLLKVLNGLPDEDFVVNDIREEFYHILVSP